MLQTPALTSAAATRSEENSFASKDVFLATLRERLRRGREKKDRKVQRYRPGLAPSWAEEGSTAAEESAPSEAGRDLLDARAAAERRREERRRRREEEAHLRQPDHDSFAAQGGFEGASRRRPVVAEVVSVSQLRPTDSSAAAAEDGLVVDTSKLRVQDLPSSSDLESSGDEDADEAARRRARARARARQRQQEEEEGSAAVPSVAGGAVTDSSSSTESSSEETSSEESDSEDEQTSRLLLLKPTFIPKGRRATVAERERIDAEAQAVVEEEKRRQRELKEDARQAVLEEIQRGTQKTLPGIEGVAMSSSATQLATTNRELSVSGSVLRTKDGAELIIDSSSEDDSEDELELERWKIRELQRLRRDRDARRQHEFVQAEVERRRTMTDAEIMAENERLGLGKDEDDRGPKMQFMQRYYHKGVFFMDENEKSELFQRDFSAPTGEDKEVDKASLPQIMQVKNWGKRGRTKYTHLVDQDTSDLANNPWASRTARHTLSKMNRFRGSAQP